MTPLRRRMIEDMRIRNLSPHTQRVYVEQVSRFARHFGLPPERLGKEEIRAWQIHLVEDRRLAASSISVAVAALRFVYTVTLRRPWIVEDDIPTSRQPKKLPVVPSPEEVVRFPGRSEKPEASDDPDRVLRDGAAHFRGGFPEARRDRQPADGHSGGGRQRPEGPVRDAVADAVEAFADLLEGGPSKRMAISRRPPRAAYHDVCRRDRLPADA